MYKKKYKNSCVYLYRKLALYIGRMSGRARIREQQANNESGAIYGARQNMLQTDKVSRTVTRHVYRSLKPCVVQYFYRDSACML